MNMQCSNRKEPETPCTQGFQALHLLFPLNCKISLFAISPYSRQLSFTQLSIFVLFILTRIFFRVKTESRILIN